MYCNCIFSILGSFLHPRRRQWRWLPSIRCCHHLLLVLVLATLAQVISIYSKSPLLFSCRNVAAAWAICGFWDWLMYLSPLAHRFQDPKKDNLSSGSNLSKSTRNCQPCCKFVMTLFGRQSEWFAPLSLRQPTAGGLPIIRSQLLRPWLKLLSPIW